MRPKGGALLFKQPKIKLTESRGSSLVSAHAAPDISGPSSTKGSGATQMALTPEERHAITDLFARMQAQGPVEKDSEAEALINQLMRRTPDSASAASSSPAALPDT